MLFERGALNQREFVRLVYFMIMSRWDVLAPLALQRYHDTPLDLLGGQIQDPLRLLVIMKIRRRDQRHPPLSRFTPLLFEPLVSSKPSNPFTG